MTNVTQLKPALTFVRLDHGIAIVRGGDVQAVITRDELPSLVLEAAKFLQR